MIRRDALTPDGSAAWILIPQIVHAHLAGDLADAWQSGRSEAPLVAALRFAARHHDDGWANWDERPGVDQGRPVNFDEMRLADSLSIWEQSIEISTIQAPLAGYLVAGHFCRLLNRFDSWRTNAATEPLATRFLTAQAAHMAALLRAWQAQDPPRHSRELAELGVSLVQLFDAISLWLCCAPRHQPWDASLPSGLAWTFSPLPSAHDLTERVSIDPWPLDPLHLRLTAAGWSVPQGNNRTVQELLAAPSESAELRWELVATR